MEPTQHYLNDTALLARTAGHSAWQLVHLLSELTLESRCFHARVVLVRRRPTPIYFKTTRDATRANYSFTDNDVCPFTNKVNRFTGVRGFGAMFLLALAQGRRPDHNFASFSILESNRSDLAYQLELQDLVTQSQMCLVAVGFTARLPVLLDASGRPLLLSRHADGQINMSSTRVGAFSPSTMGGVTIRRLILYGLGAGWPLSAEFGGERREYGQGHLDGVWLYQFDVGHRVLDELLLDERMTSTASRRPTLERSGGPAFVAGSLSPRSTGWHQIYSAKAKQSATADTLHILSGFDMFSVTEWRAHVTIVLSPMQPLLKAASVLEVGVGCGAFM